MTSKIGPMTSKKILSGYICVLMSVMLVLASCGGGSADPAEPADTTAATETTAEESAKTEAGDTTAEKSVNGDTAAAASIKLTVDGADITVKWEDNRSVESIKKLLSQGPLTIDMSAYQDFEQVGDIGSEIPSSDRRITTSPGDIVLYSGNQMVILYGSNTWEYTPLGKIEGLSKEELSQMLSKDGVTVKLAVSR